MSENIKLQSPILNGNQGVYPLTTYDQIILEDGSRWNGRTLGDNEGALVLDLTGEETETATPVNAETFSGMTYKQIMELEHGVGSFYFTMSALDDPNTKWDWMTWELVTDRFLLGAGSTYVVGSEGGEAETVITNDQLPSHYHYEILPISSVEARPIGVTTKDVTYTEETAVTSGGNKYYTNAFGYASASASTPLYRVRTGEVGGNAAHNNIPPYLSIFMWTRTA